MLIYLLWPAFREAGMEPWWKFVTFTMNLSDDAICRTPLSHAWSLCVEEHFYWLFPVLAVALRCDGPPHEIRAGIRGRVGGDGRRATHVGVATQHGDRPGMEARNWFVEDIYYPTWARLDGLLCGVALAAWKTMRPAQWGGRSATPTSPCLLVSS